MRAVMGECGSLGPAGRIACPYHGWEYVHPRGTDLDQNAEQTGCTDDPTYHPQNRYRLDGRLAKATRIKGIRDFNARDYGLVEIPVSLWGGHLAFLHLGGVGGVMAGQQQGEQGESASASPLGHLAPLLEKLEAEHGFAEGMRHVARRTYRLNCNWKVHCCGLGRGRVV